MRSWSNNRQSRSSSIEGDGDVGGDVALEPGGPSPSTTELLHQSYYVGEERRPGAYHEGPGGVSVPAGNPIASGASGDDPDDVVDVGAPHEESTNQQQQNQPAEILLEAEPVSSIVVDATPVPKEVPEMPPRWRISRRTAAILLAVSVVVIVTVVAGVVVATSMTRNPSDLPPISPALSEAFNASLPQSTMDRLQNRYSPQYRAYEWVTQVDQVALRDESTTERRVRRLRQRFALATLLYSIKSLEGLVNRTVSECQWSDATVNCTCDAASQLTALSVYNDSSTGTGTNFGPNGGNEGDLPPEIGLLTDLTDLFLVMNDLASTIPTELGLLSALTFLGLSGNGLATRIPTELGQLTKLQDLYLAGNSFISSIPTELGKLTSLAYLSLGVNSLTSSIPTELGKLSGLTFLWLSNNALTSSIPTELGKLSALAYLDIFSNSLTSSIPTELAKLSALTWLDLSSNDMTGSFPSALCYIGADSIAIDCSEVTCTCCGC